MLGRIEKVVKKKGFRNKKERDIEGKNEGFGDVGYNQADWT